MNLPNTITVVRIALIPILVVLHVFTVDATTHNAFTITIGTLYSLGALTDMLDGYLARKRGEVSDVGRFLDPLADKLLVLAGLLMLMDVGIAPMWVVLLILSREFMVTGLRLVAVHKNIVISAGISGKVKTFITNTAVSVLLFRVALAETTGFVLLYIGVALTVISGIEYFIRNRTVLKF